MLVYLVTKQNFGAIADKYNTVGIHPVENYTRKWIMPCGIINFIVPVSFTEYIEAFGGN
jgi:hypothetical protein